MPGELAVVVVLDVVEDVEVEPFPGPAAVVADGGLGGGRGGGVEDAEVLEDAEAEVEVGEEAHGERPAEHQVPEGGEAGVGPPCEGHGEEGGDGLGEEKYDLFREDGREVHREKMKICIC